MSGHYRMMREDGTPQPDFERLPPEPDAYCTLLQRNYIGMHATVMYRREIFESVGVFNRELATCEDYDMYLRIARGHAVHSHGRVIAEYRRHEAAMSMDPARMLNGALDAFAGQCHFIADKPDIRAGAARGHQVHAPLCAAAIAEAARCQPQDASPACRAAPVRPLAAFSAGVAARLVAGGPAARSTCIPAPSVISPIPKVTVLVVTYNHARFVTQALDSALAQRTNFDVEILVSEDCSTDGTRETVIAYQQKYPERIRLLLSDKNVRSNAVVARGIHAARGEYIALLDGDDYWISPDKLQKQADFLDRHAQCSCCFHNARVEQEGGTKAPWNWTPTGHPSISTFKDIWQGNFIATCSIMFRRSALGVIPAWYDSLFPITDWPLHILSAQHGDIGYLDEVLGVYRYHPGGLYSQFDQREKLERTRDFYLTMNSNLDYRHDALVRTCLSKYFFEWAEEYAQRRERANAWHCFRRYLGGRPFNEHISLKRLASLVARLLLPGSQDAR